MNSIYKNLLFLSVCAIFTSNFAIANDKYSVKNYNDKSFGLKKSGNAMEQENNAKGDSEWQLVKEPYKSPITGALVENNTLIRADGFSLSSVGIGRELLETFLVKGDFGEFEFKAYRTDQRVPSKHKMPKDSYTEFGGYEYVILDKYVIYAYLSDKDKDCKNLILKYSKDIESALLHYPVRLPFYNNIPIKEVVFDIGDWNKPKYVHARDL